MPLSPGTRLGQYEITAPIGAGGMGEVYKARDTKLNRDVAIKVLPALFASDPDRLARFEREAQILAGLSHQNIAHVYGLLDLPPEGGSYGLVMELVEGRSLDRVIESDLGPRASDLGTVLKIAVQMADALAAAHAAGIVHRDFKPGNVVVTPNGVVKVLDFGLAKAVGIESAAHAGATATALGPSPRTEKGVVMGTVSYMSPEQAAGRPVDPRSDIFSFGSVLFEMVTGQRAFDGDTSISTLAAIIHQPAKTVTQINASVPRELERLIARCHRKDPARRVQSMADLRSALEELRDDLDAGRLSGPTTIASLPVTSHGGRRIAILAVGALLLVAAGVVVGRVVLAPAPLKMPLWTFQRMTADVGVTLDPAVTPNGDLIAYASDRADGTNLDIWVQPTAGGDPVRVTTDPADDSAPTFSPDGSKIAFRSERDGGGIYVVSSLGGADRLLVAGGDIPKFSPDGKWLLYQTGGRGSPSMLYLMASAGGTPQRIAPDRWQVNRGVWSDDSRHILIVGSSAGEQRRGDFVVDVSDQGVARPPVEVTGIRAFTDAASVRLSQGAFVAWTHGRVVFAGRNGATSAIWSVGLDGITARAPLEVLYETADRISAAAASSTGTIYVASASTRVSLASIRVDGAHALSAAAEPVTHTVAWDVWPSVSADGAQVAFSSNRRGVAGAWVRDLASGRETSLPVSDVTSPVISPDGRSVAYAVGYTSSVWEIDTRGGVPRKVCDKCAQTLSSWSPDGLHLVAMVTPPVAPKTQVADVDVRTGKVVPLLDKDRTWFGRLSRDGRWMSFMDWSGGDRANVWIAPYTPGQASPESSWVRVTEGPYLDEESAWSDDGRTLYFVSNRDGFRCIYAVGFDPAAGKVLGPPQPVLHVHGTRHAIVTTADDPARLDAARGRLFFSVQDVESNIWSLIPK